MSKWISVKNKLPKNNLYVLMTDGTGVALGWYREISQEFIQMNTWENLTKHITHWMKLPNLPQKGEKE